MENVKHCAVVVRREQDVWEGTRAALGLAAHNYWAYLFILDLCLDVDEALEENLEWLDEMECARISNRQENTAAGFTYMSLEDLSRELKKMDIIIPFGSRS